MAEEVCEHFKDGECEAPAGLLCAELDGDGGLESWCRLTEQFNKIQEVSADSSQH